MSFMDKSNDKPKYKGPTEAVYAGHPRDTNQEETK